MGVNVFYAAAIFIFGLDLIICALWNSYDDITPAAFTIKSLDNSDFHKFNQFEKRGQSTTSESSITQKLDYVGSLQINPKIDRLPRDQFTYDVSELLSPEMFTNPTPALYLLRKAVDLPYKKILSIDKTLRSFSTVKNKFPARYAPYAKYLSNLVQCLSDLEQVKRSIIEIRRGALYGYFSLPSDEFSSTKSSGLFSPSIFSDITPPFKLMADLMDLSEDKMTELNSQLTRLLQNNQLPQEYARYAKGLRTFILNKLYLKDLKQSGAELRAISTADSASDSQQNTNTVRQLSAKVPLFAA